MVSDSRFKIAPSWYLVLNVGIVGGVRGAFGAVCGAAFGAVATVIGATGAGGSTGGTGATTDVVDENATNRRRHVATQTDIKMKLRRPVPSFPIPLSMFRCGVTRSMQCTGVLA